MDQLSSHVLSLRELYKQQQVINSDAQVTDARDLDLIDGILRDNIDISELRAAGAFFTGDELAKEAVDRFPKKIQKTSVVLDPTCGAGNLLIACSKPFAIDKKLSHTLESWGEQLIGFDLYENLVELTKLRIIFEALSRGAVADCTLTEALNFLHRIENKDALDASADDIYDVTHVIMNPPFSIWPSPKRDFWKPGKVNAAAVVFEHFQKIIPSKSVISAILPEVLRSGSRYDAWREFVSSDVSAEINIVGRFNSKTDVDVFILSGQKSKQASINDWLTTSLSESESSIGDFFDVSVGRLVAYRDPEEGPEYPYVHPKNINAWVTVKSENIDERRCFTGTVIKPPFVVIRRTSSPKDKYRAAGSIITGKEMVAVENHLIIIQPKDKKISSCRLLLKVLESDMTNDFLNYRIRCRHLTVGSVKQIPYT